MEIGYVARLIAIITTCIAAVIMVTAKVTISSKYDINKDVKFSIISALKYFLAANVIVFIYSIIALLISIIKKLKPINLLWIALADLVAVSMLLTGNGAASAVSAELENIDDGFARRVCSFYCRFCSQINASIGMSMVGTALYVALIILSLVIAYRRSRCPSAC
ncbi:CASP-like protein [Rhynchospora pubera]|uniref:CASP-like protein n=1 Tax=Rhynchospora pubera TaxID=906938 RepID=A0AAV8CD38_9POAL|nr:CASP-like protein [Rhynchospora pubera]